MLTIDQRAAALYAQVTDRRVAEWYRKHGGLDEALEMAEKGGGYSFDPKSGLFVGGVLRGAAGKTAVKRIIFPRPVDHHVHRGGDERVTILRGSGTIHVGPLQSFH